MRDEGLLESAIRRPFQTFDGQELYPDPLSKAAAICESIIVNHPFVDGNKRTGFLAMFSILEMHNIQLTVSEMDAYDAIIKVSTGAMDFDALRIWLLANCEETK